MSGAIRTASLTFPGRCCVSICRVSRKLPVSELPNSVLAAMVSLKHEGVIKLVRDRPAFAADLLGCPFVVLVVTPHAATARWAARPIELGGWEPVSSARRRARWCSEVDRSGPRASRTAAGGAVGDGTWPGRGRDRRRDRDRRRQSDLAIPRGTAAAILAADRSEPERRGTKGDRNATGAPELLQRGAATKLRARPRRRRGERPSRRRSGCGAEDPGPTRFEAHGRAAATHRRLYGSGDARALAGSIAVGELGQ